MTETELDQVELFISMAKFSGLKVVLEKYANNLKTQANEIKTAAEVDTKPIVVSEEAHPQPPPPPLSEVVRTSLPDLGLTYIPVQSFAWDQGEYNSPTVTVYVEIPGVGAVKDSVHCDFTSSSFDLRVLNLNGKNHRLIKDNLEKDIIPSESKIIVKNDKVVIKLKKVKGEYSYEHWAKLSSNKPRSERKDKDDNPAGKVMDLMKDLYDEGDENTRKIIGEAMLKTKEEKLSRGLME